jgi:pimeloyl-ACP methyl ester carboxylesterase
LGAKIWKMTKRVLLSLLGLIVGLIGAGLGYRAYWQHQSAKAMVIDRSSGIDEGLFVKIGGIDQWVTIRGQDRNNPVLLMVHGGPGVTMSPTARDSLSWERDFTIVQWDQRGAGKTFGRSGPLDPTVTIDRMAQDGVEVAEFLRLHLHRQRVTLVGVSWGTILGVHMAKAQPQLFSAYVGTGQIVNARQGQALGYAQLLAEVRASRDRGAIRALEAIGAPPYNSLSELGVHTKWALANEARAPSTLGILSAVLLAPRSTLWDFGDWIAGLVTSQNHFYGKTMSGPIMAVDLPAFSTDFAIPMFVFQGADDNITPAKLARAYIDRIRAPHKELVLITGAGHVAIVTKNNEFLNLLLQRVRPLTIQREQTTRSLRPL